VKRVEFIAEAREEFLAEVSFYEAAQKGLGAKFSSAVEKATALAVAFPNVGSPAAEGTRRVVVKGFPFLIVYKRSATGILVFAVAHQSRRPNYWRSRA